MEARLRSELVQVIGKVGVVCMCVYVDVVSIFVRVRVCCICLARVN
jgi:hypothetical protein